MFKKRITRLITVIVSYLLLIGTYWIYPTIHMGNNIFKNITILLIGQPILFMFLIAFNTFIIALLVFITCVIIYQIFTWIMKGN